MNWPLFFSIFSVIFLAEFPDKTSFATMLMAARGRPLAVFAGVAAAYVVQSVVAVVFGNVLALAPEKWVHIGAAVVFLVFAALAWWKNEEEVEAAGAAAVGRFFPTVWRSFVVIFIAEWGDITQLATVTFVARHPHDVLTVFLAAVAGLWAATAVTVALGMRLSKYVSPPTLQKISALVFGLVGAVMLIEALR